MLNANPLRGLNGQLNVGQVEEVDSLIPLLKQLKNILVMVYFRNVIKMKNMKIETLCVSLISLFFI